MSGNVKDLGEGKRGSVGTVQWIYPCDEPAPKGVKVFLLTKGGVTIEGTWNPNGSVIAWQHLFKRNRSKE